MNIKDAIIQGLLGEKIRRKVKENGFREFDYYTISENEFIGHVIEDDYRLQGAQLSFEDIIANDWEVFEYEEPIWKINKRYKF